MIRNAILVIAALPLVAAPPVPRAAPEFTIHLANGGTKQLSSFKGKVVVLEFVHTTCPHCQHSCMLMNQLYNEFGKDGFQPVAIAWNESAESLAPAFVKQLGLSFPVGFSDASVVMPYLGISYMERSVVPQMVWIDRTGVIRSQTPSIGDESMLTESYYRKMITTLLAEPAPTAPAKRVRAGS